MTKNLIFLLLLLNSCGTMERIALTTTARVVEKGSDEIFTENNWEMFRRGVPANLKFMEGLLYLDPTNENLLRSLIKGYTGYAYAVNETLYLEDYLLENDNNFNLDQALKNYRRSLEYGMRYLQLRGIDFAQMNRLVRLSSGALTRLLDNKLNDEDLAPLFFLANAWGGLINLQKRDLDLVAQLPIVKSLFDWACWRQPDFQHGACGIFNGIYAVSRPKMLGGDPAGGKSYFEDTIKKYPYNLLVRVIYIQYVIVPLMDADAFERQKRFFQNVMKMKKDVASGHREINLYNAVALKRWEIILKQEKEIF